MDAVPDVVADKSPSTVHAVLCIHPEALDRFYGVLRHLLVGLVDQAIQLRLLSSDRRIERLSLGPVQAFIHGRVGWPLAKRRIETMVDALSPRSPTIVHALSGASYAIAGAIADVFDAELVLQVTSIADCEAIARWNGPHVGRFLAMTTPLLQVLTDQLNIPPDRAKLVRPGVLASKRVACFADPDRLPTVLCPTSLERGRVDALIEAVGILTRRDHSFMLFLLGRGRQESAVRRLIRDRKLAPWIAIVDPSGGLTRAMRNADILVLPFPETGFTAEGLQAMGAGLALIAVPSPVADYFHHNETAILCPVDDDEKGGKKTGELLAQAIESLLEDRAGARRMAGAAMDYVRQHHAMSSMAEQTADAYRQLLLPRTTLSLP